MHFWKETEARQLFLAQHGFPPRRPPNTCMIGGVQQVYDICSRLRDAYMQLEKNKDIVYLGEGEISTVGGKLWIDW